MSGTSSAQPSAASARTAIVLVNWNGWRECIECLDSLFAQDHLNCHIVIVDNDSADGSIEQIARWCESPRAKSTWRSLPGVARITQHPSPRPILHRIFDRPDGVVPPPPPSCPLTLIRSGRNLGFAGGCNLGVRAAGPANFDYFWFLNADTVVDRAALTELLARAARDAATGIVGSTLIFYDRPEVVQALGGAQLDPADGSSRHIGYLTAADRAPEDGALVEREMAYVVGASMLVSAEFIRRVGPMQEDYFLYYEEIDWAMRGRGEFTLGYAPRSRVYHKSGANSSKVIPLGTARYYYRNRLRFVRRFLPERLGAAKRSLFVEMLRHLARGRWGLARVVGSVFLSGPSP